MKVTILLGLLLVLLGVHIGCREIAMPFETIDAIGVLERADLHGQLGHLIQVESSPNNGRSGGATTVYATVFDKDISDAPYYLQWRHTPVRKGDYLSNIADVLGRAKDLTLVSKLPKGVPFYEEVVIGKPNTTIADSVTHCLKVTTADGVFYLGVHIVFTDTVKAWFATKLSQPLRIFFLEEKEDEPPPQLLLSLLPDVVRTAVVKDTAGTLTVSLPKEVVAAAPVSDEETLRLAAYSRDVLEPPPPTTAPPTIAALSAVSDNSDTAQAAAGDTVTLTFTTNKPIVLKRSKLLFKPANGSHGRVTKAVTGADNRYTSEFRITNSMAAGILRASITLVDDDGNTSGAIVRDTGVTISQPVMPPIVEEPAADERPPLEPLVHPDQEFWDRSRVRASLYLQQLSDGMAGVAAGLSNEKIIAWYEEGLLSVDLLDPGLEFILYDLYGICLQEQPEIAAEAVREGGIIIHPLAKNALVFDWLHLAHGYPDASKEERLVLFRRLVRFWGVGPVYGKRSVNGHPIGAPVLPEDYIYIQPPANPLLTVNERQVKRRLEDIDQRAQQLLADHPGLSVIKIYNASLSSGFGILVDFIFTDLWNIYKTEQPAQAAAIAVEDIPLYPISGNGLLVAWLVLQYDNPDKSKDERLVLFRRLAREGGVQVILAE